METQNSDERPNIVFIFADQMRAHVLGCYGNEMVPTPNIDAMAAAASPQSAPCESFNLARSAEVRF